MTPIVELLIQDIEDEKLDIENLSEKDFKRVLETYNSLYKRCVNLKEEDFDNAETHRKFIESVKMINNSEFITLNWLKNEIDSVSSDKFFELREILKVFVIIMKRDC